MKTKSDMTKKNTPKRKPYQKPTLRSEPVLEAELGATCNGSTAGGRKAVGPCTVIKT